MAITKIHPIKSTLKKAIDYIVDPAKTDDKLLVSSFGCAVETADLEFEKTRLLAMQKGNNLAHHLIQAFEPGEVSYAQAHEIGRQLADEILGGKYEYVIATHINKEHCHNHIIFCAVDFAEHKKYISNRKSYAQIRHVSDRLCRENGLSVVTPGAERSKQYAEWDAQRKGTSYKQKLKIAIDRLIPISKDLDDLLRRLEAEGYEIKRGKYISFRAPGQERFTRAKTLGEAYTEEAIAERIKGKVILKTPKLERSGVSLLIDIENCIKAQQSAGYERWAKIENLKRAARTMVFLDQHGISHYTDLEQKITELQDSNEQTAAALKTAEHRLSDLALLIKHTATYKGLNSVYTRSGQNSTPNSNATNLHSSQKRCCSFCISSSNASPTFQVQKSIFHQMTKPIQVTVILPLLLAISFSRNDDIHSSISGISNDLIGVIPTIGQ